MGDVSAMVQSQMWRESKIIRVGSLSHQLLYSYVPELYLAKIVAAQ